MLTAVPALSASTGTTAWMPLPQADRSGAGKHNMKKIINCGYLLWFYDIKTDLLSCEYLMKKWLHMLECILIQMDTEEKGAPDRTAKGPN